MKPLGTLAHQQHTHQDSIQQTEGCGLLKAPDFGNCKVRQSVVLSWVSCCFLRPAFHCQLVFAACLKPRDGMRFAVAADMMHSAVFVSLNLVILSHFATWLGDCYSS